VVFLDDEFGPFFLDGLCAARGIPIPQAVVVGQTNRMDAYEDYLKGDAFVARQVTSIGFLTDSEFPGVSVAAEDSAFLSLCGFFRRMGWPVPKDVDEFVETSLGCKAGIHIIPGRKQPGCLETLCLRAVAGDPALKCVDEFVSCLDRQGIPLVGGQREKARMQAFVASRSQPQTSLKTHYLDKQTWNYGSPEYDRLERFLRML